MEDVRLTEAMDSLLKVLEEGDVEVVARAVFNLDNTRQLLDRLHNDPSLRRLCGWESRREIPHESQFSRAFASFAASELPQRLHAALIESIQKFRQAMEASGDASIDVSREYLAMLEDGVIAAQYLEAWQTDTDEAVLIAPAYTFLMMNRPATVQVWLDAGSSGWWTTGGSRRACARRPPRW